MINITQEDYSVLKQPIQQRYIKLYLLNFAMQRVDEVSGNLIDLSINIDANADVRRTCRTSLVVTDSSFEIGSSSKIWLNRYIQPFIGTYDIKTGEIIWRNQGVYLINAPTWTYDGADKTLSFEGLDLTCKLTGVRNGQLEGITHQITQGSNVRDAIIGTLSLAGFTQYVVSECVNANGTIQSVPYDIEISAGGTVWDILVALRDILPNYQMYFDINGVFIYEPIPSGENEPIVLDDDLLPSIITSEQVSTDFTSVKNYVEVWGATHDVQWFSSNTSIGVRVVSLTINGLDDIIAGTMIGWQADTELSSSLIYLNVNNKGNKRLVDYDGNNITHLDANTYYVAVYQSSNTWLFMGHLQAQAVWGDYNEDSPFYINGETGKIRYVCSGDDYNNIQTDDLALQRAKMEIYWRCRLNDTISITTIPIPWIDVNVLIRHRTHPKSITSNATVSGENVDVGTSGVVSNENVTLSIGVVDEENLILSGTIQVPTEWMIDTVSANYDCNGSMTITAHRYYPYYITP